jgi:hypothetical protein
MTAPRARWRFTRVCDVTPGDRVMRGVLSVIAASFAVSQSANLWCAIPAGVCAVFLAIGAITGWCPTNLLPRREQPIEQNTLGYPEARIEV